MRKLVYLVILFFYFSFSVCAQNTNVSGTVTDAGGQAWVLGTYEFDFVPSPRFQGQYRQNGVPFNPVAIAGSLDATASFTNVSVPDNNTITPAGTQWSITICPQATTKCFTSVSIVITGVSQTVTSSLIPPAISMSCGPPQKAYADVELQCAQGGYYFNLLTNRLRLCTASTPPNTCNTWVDAGSGATNPGGVPIQTQVNNSGVFGGTPCENFGNISTGPVNADCDWHSKGPNPYVDITRFGARTCNPNIAPCAAGVTASINSGSFTATLSSASTFINGDGIVIYGAGSANGLSTPAAPTVTNVLAQMGTGTDLVVPGATGSTTKCYKIIARTTGGGYTPASPETCTTTGQSTLGVVTVNLSGCTRAVTTVTCTTSTPHPILVGFVGGTGAEVYIGSTTISTVIDSSFRGWRDVVSATDSTHFTFIDSAINTGNGATTTCSGCGSGGTATFYTANHLSWTAVANAWLYYIYGGASGAETLIGVSRPQNIAGSQNFTTWDDFSNLMQNYTFPPWIPTIPPSVGANNNLSTTVVSGAGTTSLTLFNSAGTTVSGAGIRLDAGVGIAAAAAAAADKGILFVPEDPSGSNNLFAVNNYCDLTPYRIPIMQSGNLWLHETIAMHGAGLRYTGDRLSGYGTLIGGGATSWGSVPQVVVLEAVPGVYLSNAGSYTVSGLNMQGNVANGILLMLSDTNGGAFNANFVDVGFNTGTAAQDLMGFGLIIRNLSGIFMDRVSLSNGTAFVDGGQNNTPFYCNQCGDLTIKNAYETHTGIIFNGNTAGENVIMTANHYNGGFTPLLRTIGGVVGVTLGQENFGIIMDTVGHPCLSSYGSGPNAHLNCAPSGYSFNAPSVTGSVNAVIYGTAASQVFNNSLSTTINSDGTNLVLSELGPGGISAGYNGDSIFVQNPPISAPTCSVSAGGSVPIGTWVFYEQPVFWNGSGGTASAASASCTTTSGNQTITINWTAPTGNPKQVELWAGHPGGGAQHCDACGPFSPGTVSSVWSTSGIGSPTGPTIPLAGASMIMPANQGIAAPAYLTSSAASGGFASTATSSTLTANRSTTWPDTNGMIATSSYQNSVYDNFNRANGAIGSNWTVSGGAFNVSSNIIVGGGGTNAASWTATAVFFPDQFSQTTVVSNGGGGVAVRVSPTAVTGYVYWFDGGNREIGRYVSGAFTSLTTTAGSFSAGDVIRLEIVGTTLTAFRNGAVDLTTSNGTVISGQPGLISIGGAATFDNWSGGNLHPIAQLDTEQDWTQPQHFTQPVTIGTTNPIAGALSSGSISISGHYLSNGPTPTCSVTGAGTGATCTILTNATDTMGSMIINTGTTPAANGTITLLYGAPYVSFGICALTLQNGLSSWNARATVIVSAPGVSSTVALWDNNAVNLTASQSTSVEMVYVCSGR